MPDLNRDWDGTLRQMAAMGYTLIDMWAGNPYTTRTRQAAARRVHARGPRLQRLPLRLRAWSDSLGQTLDYANALGVRHVICGPRPKMTTSDDWKGMAA